MTDKFFIEPLFSNFIASDILDVDCDKIGEKYNDGYGNTTFSIRSEKKLKTK